VHCFGHYLLSLLQANEQINLNYLSFKVNSSPLSWRSWFPTLMIFFGRRSAPDVYCGNASDTTSLSIFWDNTAAGSCVEFISCTTMRRFLIAWVTLFESRMWAAKQQLHVHQYFISHTHFSYEQHHITPFHTGTCRFGAMSLHVYVDSNI